GPRRRAWSPCARIHRRSPPGDRRTPRGATRYVPVADRSACPSSCRWLPASRWRRRCRWACSALPGRRPRYRSGLPCLRLWPCSLSSGVWYMSDRMQYPVQLLAIQHLCIDFYISGCFLSHDDCLSHSRYIQYSAKQCFIPDQCRVHCQTIARHVRRLVHGSTNPEPGNGEQRTTDEHPAETETAVDGAAQHAAQGGT